MEKRTWMYVQNPKQYGIECNLCNGENIQWSEFDHHIWCYDCEKDIKGTEGLFGGPILANVCRLMGICFDMVNIETGEMDYFTGGLEGEYVDLIKTKKSM